MRRFAVPALFLTGSAAVIATEWRYDPVLVGVGCMVCGAGILLAKPQMGWTWNRRTVFIAVTSACWIAVFLTGGEVGANPATTALAATGTLLLLGGWCAALAREWRSWWAVVLWFLAQGVALASGELFLPAEVAIGAWLALLAYGLWVFPVGLRYGRSSSARKPGRARGGRRSRRRAREARRRAAG